MREGAAPPDGVGVGPGPALRRAAAALGPLLRPPRHVTGGGVRAGAHRRAGGRLLHGRRQVGDRGAQDRADAGVARAGFLAPVDALHGDIGALFPANVLVPLSKSGASDELLALAPCARVKGAYLVSLTSAASGADCPLFAACDLNVHLPLQGEVCPFGLAPVTSTVIQMVFGDTVVTAIMETRRLSKDQYASNHPAGKIGKTLTFKVIATNASMNRLPAFQFLPVLGPCDDLVLPCQAVADIRPQILTVVNILLPLPCCSGLLCSFCKLPW
jgi:hypothetical protein